MHHFIKFLSSFLYYKLYVGTYFDQSLCCCYHFFHFAVPPPWIDSLSHPLLFYFYHFYYYRVVFSYFLFHDSDFEHESVVCCLVHLLHQCPLEFLLFFQICFCDCSDWNYPEHWDHPDFPHLHQDPCLHLPSVFSASFSWRVGLAVVTVGLKSLNYLFQMSCLHPLRAVSWLFDSVILNIMF